jgi:mercuric ion transport protein
MKSSSEPGALPGGAPLPGATGLIAALLAATCCILPLLLILSGIAGAGVMMSMMRYEWLTLPLGTVGLAAAWGLYLRRKRRCETQACQFVGRRVNQVLLGVATVIVALALLLKIFPSWTAAILQSLHPDA